MKISTKTKYYIRLFLDKTLSVFHLSIIQEWIKKILNRQGWIDEKFIKKRLEEKLSKLNDIKKKYKVKIVYEQGTGWHGIDLVVFYILNFERIESRDVRKLLDVRQFKKVISFCYNNNYFNDQQKNQLYNFEDNSLHELLHKMKINYHSTRNFNLKNSSMSQVLFYSDSVLQRLKYQDLKIYIKSTSDEFYPDSIHYHRVDCKDFFSIGKESIIPPLYYLLIPRKFWELITSKYLNYQNRLRIYDFKNVFSQYFDIETSNERTICGVNDYLSKNLKKLSIPKHLLKQCSICHFDLIGKSKISGSNKLSD